MQVELRQGLLMTRRSDRRDLLLLASGQAISTAGDAAALIALLLRLRPAGSGWVAGLLAAELAATVLLAPLAGFVVDRFESHRVLVIALASQAVTAIPLAFVATPWATVGLFAGLAGASIFVRPATSALVPVITGEEDAPRGYSRLATGTSLGWIAGPIVGGAITGTLGVTTALVVDAASFAFLTGAAAFVRTRRPPIEAPETRPGRRGTGGGFGLIWRSPVLRIALAITAVAAGCAVIDNVAAPYRFINQLGASSTAYGAYLTLWGVGAFLGVQVLPKLPRAKSETALACANLLIGVGIGGIGVAPNVPIAFIASVVGGVGNGLANVAMSALLADHTPSSHRGRVFASAGAIVQSAAGIGTTSAAPLVIALGGGGAMIVAGTLTAFVATFGVGASVRYQRTRALEPPSRAAPLPDSSAIAAQDS